MSVFCVYAYVNTRTYTSIYAHIYAYIRAYVSLLCIPISFFMWSIVSQTKNIIFLGNENASKQNLHIVKTSCRSMKAILYFEYSITLPNFRLLKPKLAWSWASKIGKKIETFAWTRTLYFNTWTLCICISARVGKSFVKCLLFELAFWRY